MAAVSFPRSLSRDHVLPLAFCALGVGYYVVTALREPERGNIQAAQLHERHKRDARIGLFAGLGAGVVLWWMK
jgi:hypothetical protein